jgi:hypothetical protein
MKRKVSLFFFLAGLNLILGLKALAFCPVCTVAVGAGVGLSRYFGIDDTITGVWIGGLMVSISFWTIDWLKKKKWDFKFRNFIVFAAYYLLVVMPLYFMDIIGHPFNRIWGIDKLILGVIFGSIVFYLAGAWYQYLKKKNNGHAHFPMEKVVIPVGALVILSFIFYFIIK